MTRLLTGHEMIKMAQEKALERVVVQRRDSGQLVQSGFRENEKVGGGVCGTVVVLPQQILLDHRSCCRALSYSETGSIVATPCYWGPFSSGKGRESRLANVAGLDQAW